MSDLDKVFYIHNWIIRHADYGDVVDNNGNVLGTTWKAKGALVDGKIRCAGYAETFQLVMDRLGIECERVSSNPMNGMLRS